MPIYEYKCQSCDKDLEVFVRGGKEPEFCPECHGKLSRKVSLAGVIFKGSGFYVNDSKSPTSSSTSSSSSGEAKPDSKNGADSKTSSEATNKETAKVKSEAAPSPKAAD